MTSSVKVTAHCATTKEVHVGRFNDADDEEPSEMTVLQDGESIELVVFDEYVVAVKEVLKQVEETVNE